MITNMNVSEYKETKNVKITTECTFCGNKNNNTFEIDWNNQRVVFECGNCGYDSEKDTSVSDEPTEEEIRQSERDMLNKHGKIGESYRTMMKRLSNEIDYKI